MEKAHELRYPSPPMKPDGRNSTQLSRVPPRGAFSAKMLGLPSTPTFSTDNPLPEHDDDEFHGEIYDYAFVSARRASGEGDNQALSPPPPPPPPYHSSSSVRTARTLVPTSADSSVKGNHIPTRRASGSAKSTPSVHSPMSKNGEQPKQQSTDSPTPSVHPIDTLSKKLRQQAMELTHVYEELEKQRLQLDAYKLQIQDQKWQLDKLREQRRKSIDGSSKASSHSRARALEQQKRAAQMMVGTPSTGASLGQKRGELDRKLKEAEREKKKHELAAKRIEKALVELQVFQNDRMEKLFPSGRASNQGEDEEEETSSVLNEQRAYIRVLEEAVHLKATDFAVTGHEELLIVLAELRHTIYEQEKDVEEKSKQLSSAQMQLQQERQQHLATNDLLAAAQKRQQDVAKHFHGQESALQAQMEAVERQLHERDHHLNQLQSLSTDAQRTEEALQNRLAAATKAQNLTGSQLQDAARSIKALQEKLEEISTQYEEVQQQNATLREECAKKQSHLDEMNALQEEVLGSVDKYVGKVKKSRDKVERLELELQSRRETEALAQKQSELAARASGEREAVLQGEVDAAEYRAQQFQTQCTALEQEKNRLESALAEVQRNLEGQVHESSEQREEIAAKEQKCRHVQEAVTELEAALFTALLMMLNNAPGASRQQFMDQDADENAFLLDPFVLCELEICCQALSTLTTDNGPTQGTSVCPSFPEMVARVATIGENVLKEVNRALASWARERTNLVEACAMLDSTARLCQDEMEKRHDEIREYREQLAERTSEVEAYALQLETLDEQLRSAQTECEAYHALEEHTVHQDKSLEAKQALIRDLSAENDRLAQVESAYSVQGATNARYSQRLADQQEAIKEHKRYADELEQALENAAIFAEQQNECSQQLHTQLAEMEHSQREQVDQIKTLEVQNSAFSSRLVGLVKQYTTFLRPLAATDRCLQDHLHLFDAEVQNGDVLRLLQLFPALLEEYISMSIGNPEQDPPFDAREPHWRRSKSSISTNSTKKKPRRLVGWSPEEKPRQHVEMATVATWTSEPTPSKASSSPTALKVAVTRNPQLLIAVENEEAQLAEQLELIRGAFQSYKGHVETHREEHGDLL
ncbi:hypothetical protein PHYPSEUDO_014616 [Phytophthora pseudosyringae]|uniref:Uncharacterized protein n=1 Tax=Phytophthora pseudosyringae TaxID=221518 RepID=A0A8T1V532_9STRA|nr:hypothetical protein PHYPSEUDO_014616 [Phytophthora pseudosyringae]